MHLQMRRDKINEKLKALQELLPNCTKVRSAVASFGHIYMNRSYGGASALSPDLRTYMFQTDKVSMLDEAIDYLKSLQLQLQVLIINGIISYAQPGFKLGH